jgi:hypothetical protein
MNEENSKMRVLVIGEENASMIAKLMLEKGIDCEIVTDANFEKEKLNNEIIPFELKELDINLFQNLKEDNHCWWQRFEKRPNNRNSIKGKRYGK